MNRRTFLGAASAGGLWGCAAHARASRSSPGSPNVVLIFADDLGYGDLGCYGSKIPTPNIDRIAAGGVRFTDFYSASSVCTPSRAALLTGRYPARVGLVGVLQAADSGGLPAHEVTIAQMLKWSGYKTACIGKWHLGSKREYLPTNRGFDEYFGIPYSNDMWPLPLMRNTEVIEEPARMESLTRFYTEQAASFIERSKDSPFFLYLPHSAPHIPLAASQQFRGSSALGTYGDVITELDWSVGQVLRSLQENGLEENTLIIFASDNGPWYQGSAGQLRGRKGETYDGGMRVPCVARFPGRIPEGRVCRDVATTMDILPTLARVCGASLPGGLLDGIDIWPLLSGEMEEIERDPFLFFDGWNLQCARKGPWKLHVARYSSRAWNPSPVGGRVNLPLPRPELYNVATDLQECYDCSREHPSVASDLRERMEQMLFTFPEPVGTLWRDTIRRQVESTPAGALPIEKKA